MKTDVPVRVRLGSGANCSSIGSVLDLLFATAAVGAAVLAAAAAAAGTKEASEPEPNVKTEAREEST